MRLWLRGEITSFFYLGMCHTDPSIHSRPVAGSAVFYPLLHYVPRQVHEEVEVRQPREQGFGPRVEPAGGAVDEGGRGRDDVRGVDPVAVALGGWRGVGGRAEKGLPECLFACVCVCWNGLCGWDGPLLCFALLCFALLCFALLCFALLLGNGPALRVLVGS